MEIKFLTQDALDFLKNNLEENLELYQFADSSWIEQQVGYDPFVLYKSEIDDFTLDPTAKEIENVKLLYLSMRGLTDSDATDERLWSGLSHGTFWSFMQNNLLQGLQLNPRLKFNKGLVLNRYFFNIAENGRKRSLYINNLAKLWWAGRLTYDKDDTTDPFKALTLFETAFSHKIINTFSSNFMANSEIRFAVFDTGLYLQNKGITIKGDTLIPLLKFLNQLGGSIILDVFSREELKEMLIKWTAEHIDEIVSR